jgi:hypothetical protein
VPRNLQHSLDVVDEVTKLLVFVLKRINRARARNGVAMTERTFDAARLRGRSLEF